VLIVSIDIYLLRICGESYSPLFIFMSHKVDEVWFRCELDTGKVACWYSNDLCLRMSAVAAGVLASEKKIDLNKLEPLSKLICPWIIV
jgi:hypothetical protein